MRTKRRPKDNPEQAASTDHETHVPSIQNSPRPHTWVPCPYENAWRPGGDQRPAGEGSQAPRPLSGRTRRSSASVVAKLRLGSLSERSEFETMLRLTPLAVSPHFALYYRNTQTAETSPDRAGEPNASPLLTELASTLRESVDNIPIRLGIVLPKRLSKRAITRSLLKRQIRAAATRKLNHLQSGIWIVRQRTAFRTAASGSAASDSLKLEARLELDGLLEKAWRDVPGRLQ